MQWLRTKDLVPDLGRDVLWALDKEADYFGMTDLQETVKARLEELSKKPVRRIRILDNCDETFDSELERAVNAGYLLEQAYDVRRWLITCTREGEPLETPLLSGVFPNDSSLPRPEVLIAKRYVLVKMAAEDELDSVD